MTCWKGMIGAVSLGASLLSHAAQPPPNKAVMLPERAYARPSPPDADQKAARAIWRKHQQDMFDALSASDSPRDWMVAALIDFFPADAVQLRQQRMLIARATDMAPDDVLVQWITALQLEVPKDRILSDSGALALQRLQTLEPDNAMVWLLVLNQAAKANDTLGVDAALVHMAAATRADLHWAGVMKTIMDAYQRYPVPDDYMAYASKLDNDYPLKLATPYTVAGSIGVITMIPGYVYLMRSCGINPATGQHAWRDEDCAAVGRLLAAKGDTTVTNHLGYDVLRVSHTYNGKDVANARVLDWLGYQQIQIERGKKGSAMERQNVRVSNWIVAGNELDSIRYEVAAQGMQLTPPSDWVDTASPFSAARLRDDARYPTENISQSY